ncbi:MAG: histidine--tRNA ligase [archaeon]
MKFQEVRGTKDLAFEDSLKFMKLLKTGIEVFEKYGFEPVITPCLENLETLTAKSGENIKEEIYWFKDKADRDIALRFDLTIGTSRFLGNTNVSSPFKRYSFGPVWRYDKPGALRYREFWQLDVDIFGSKSPYSDAECILACVEVLEKLGIRDLKIYISNRKYFESFLEKIGIEREKFEDIMRSVDKLYKIGIEGVRKELEEKKVEKIDEILEFSSKKGGKEILDKELQGYEDLAKLYEILAKNSKNVEIDLSVVRGLGYYDGNVCEIKFGDLEQTICAGGRYDGLIEKLSGKKMAATGMSIGVYRIIEILKNEDLWKTKLMVCCVPDFLEDAFQVAKKFRENGVPCICELDGKDLKKQLEYADKKRIPYVVVIGKKEKETGKLTLRDMETGEQSLLSFEEILERLKKIR